jgi:hypothetical protein
MIAINIPISRPSGPASVGAADTILGGRTRAIPYSWNTASHPERSVSISTVRSQQLGIADPICLCSCGLVLRYPRSSA